MTFIRTVAPLWVLAAAISEPAGTVDKPIGYLSPGEFNVMAALEPAPRPGDPRYQTDRKIFRATRKLLGTPRWQLATTDAEYAAPSLMRDFSCAVGVSLTPGDAPKLLAVVERAAVDTGKQTNQAKEIFARHRPFTIDHGPICQPASELFDKKHNRMSYDYPSGHTTWGWTWALILTAIAPDRSEQILRRGRAYGDSRFVCGAHNESAVEAGMQSASATMSVISTKTGYQADLAAARAEVSVLRENASFRPQECEAESTLVAQRVMPKLDKLHDPL